MFVDHELTQLRFWGSFMKNSLAVDRLEFAGGWLVEKWRKQAQAEGHRRAAANMRKQGIQFEVALAILLPGAEARPRAGDRAW